MDDDEHKAIIVLIEIMKKIDGLVNKLNTIIDSTVTNDNQSQKIIDEAIDHLDKGDTQNGDPK